MTKIMLFIKGVLGLESKDFDADKAQEKLKAHRLKEQIYI